MRGLLSMQKVNSSFFFKVLPRAFLVFLVCLSLVAFSSYTAPKAQAEAVTLSLTTAFLMLAIAVMATLGVTLTASTNQDAIDYINDPFISFLQGKGYNSITEYLTSAGITSLVQLCTPVFGAVNIVKPVYDIIAEFCTSFFANEGVQSGGSPVGEVGSINHGLYRGSISATGIAVHNGEFPLNTSISSDGKTITMSGTANSSWVIRLNPGRYNYSVSTSAPYYRLAYILLAQPYPSTNVSNSYGSTPVYTNDKSGTFGVADNRSLAVGLQQAPSGYTATITITATSGTLQDPSGFVLVPSATVLAPPHVATGQTYSIPSSNTRSDDDIEKAINDVVAPLTTTGGLSKTASVAGKAVPAEYEWLHEDTQAIRNNTNPHFDFIPSSLGFDFSIWHYVTEMMSSVNSAIALFGSFVQNMPPAILVFPFGVFALCITVALFRRFLS